MNADTQHIHRLESAIAIVQLARRDFPQSRAMVKAAEQALREAIIAATEPVTPMVEKKARR